MILIWIVGALAAAGVLYLALPFLMVAFMACLRILFYIVLFYVGYRLLLFLLFLATKFFAGL